MDEKELKKKGANSSKIGEVRTSTPAELEEAERKFNVMSSAIRTSAHTKRREQEDGHQITKRLQQNMAQKGERAGNPSVEPWFPKFSEQARSEAPSL
eukprot:CAMPEP_0171930770 /NCGR_PEP_ID=MMETSP0993-20121228/28918_1 /TAXON_ID=483369 /ORGANISM="non described non described, Strain CCMP2098" /LENGTH=96 /DNA_ID=CAMNT_0012570677 /DNA_START=373 /DNA_END=660 /DNA_ORIENTATION=-